MLAPTESHIPWKPARSGVSDLNPGPKPTTPDPYRLVPNVSKFERTGRYTRTKPESF